MSGAPTVVNIRTLPRNPADWPPDHVYIGRAMTSRHFPESPWSNPFRIGIDGTREEVIAKYEARLLGHAGLLARLPELRGKVLVCWCKESGREVACHGDVLARLASAEPEKSADLSGGR